ncbi:MAG: thioredoxin domain-containing protein, partial [Candidatus Limnocylindrales bacterium]
MPTDRVPEGTNHLAGETSPYLLQHAHNPVDWYPWGDEALNRARAEAKPIFLSIGYAACHWCHVMERESFEDEATAADLNADFVSIKVDREERPDLDAVYMDAVQAMTGGGGWPMSVFLTPDGQPFYGGTYFPDEPRHGMPAFRQVLASVAVAWRDERPQVEAAAARLTSALRDQAARMAEAARAAAAATEAASATAPALGGLVGLDGRPLLSVTAPVVGPVVDAGLLDRATATLSETFDAANGGWGGAPKFPAPMTIEHLLRRFVRAGDVQALTMARRTLDAMAAGGINDQLGGGFARYATDAVWLVPHFDKILYDNAQLALAYLHAWQVTDERRYREVAEATLDYLVREMTVPDGAFAASQDADTDGEEGGTYVWTADEVRAVLGAEDTGLFADAFDVTESGNWEEHTILRRVRDDVVLAARHAIPEAEVAARLMTARERLFTARGSRLQPARDDKALAAWNGLAIAALAEASVALDRPDYAEAATTAADALWGGLRTPAGRLMRSWKDGRAMHAAVLEDHADL